ncbi:MAG: hypothetical protein GY812_09940 [Actinomycetia bacterium]|nr:hypothetical protein [Actinomycetes bacterium]
MSRRARYSVGAVVATVVVLCTAGIAGAQDSIDPYVGPTPSVAPQTTVLVPSEPAAAAAQAQVQGETLAFTGGDVAAVAVLGAVLLGGGALLLNVRRRPHAVA